MKSKITIGRLSNGDISVIDRRKGRKRVVLDSHGTSLIREVLVFLGHTDVECFELARAE